MLPQSSRMTSARHLLPAILLLGAPLSATLAQAPGKPPGSDIIIPAAKDDRFVKRCRFLALRRQNPKLDAMTTTVEHAAMLLDVPVVHDAVAACRMASASYPTDRDVIIATHTAVEALGLILFGLTDHPRTPAEAVSRAIALAEKEGLPRKSIDSAAMDRLKAYRWPGNVRELENLVRRLAALYSEEVIGVEIVEAEIADAAPVQNGASSTAPAAAAAPADETLSQAVERHLKRQFDGNGEALPPAGVYDRVLHDVERPLISLCLRATRGNQLKAAALLGLNRNTLRKKIRELDIEVMRGVK